MPIVVHYTPNVEQDEYDASFDDQTPQPDAPSTENVPPVLEPYGEAGTSFLEAGPKAEEASRDRRTALATGDAGTVYLCHPFLVHAAQPHRGTRPRFMAQPPLPPAEPITLDRADGDYSPVEQAIRTGLGKS